MRKFLSVSFVITLLFFSFASNVAQANAREGFGLKSMTDTDKAALRRMATGKFLMTGFAGGTYTEEWRAYTCSPGETMDGCCESAAEVADGEWRYGWTCIETGKIYEVTVLPCIDADAMEFQGLSFLSLTLKNDALVVWCRYEIEKNGDAPIEWSYDESKNKFSIAYMPVNRPVNTIRSMGKNSVSVHGPNAWGNTSTGEFLRLAK